MINKKEVREFAYDLVSDRKNEYCLLSDAEKEKITGLIIKNTEIINVWEYITEADYKNELPNMLSKYLETGSKETGIEILELLKNNAMRYASREAIEIIEEQSKEYNYNKQYECEEE